MARSARPEEPERCWDKRIKKRRPVKAGMDCETGSAFITLEPQFESVEFAARDAPCGAECSWGECSALFMVFSLSEISATGARGAAPAMGRRNKFGERVCTKWAICSGLSLEAISLLRAFNASGDKSVVDESVLDKSVRNETIKE
jgi:hypothetical protein